MRHYKPTDEAHFGHPQVLEWRGPTDGIIETAEGGIAFDPDQVTIIGIMCETCGGLRLEEGVHYEVEELEDPPEERRWDSLQTF